MVRRTLLRLTLLAGVALVAAGCGGGSTSTVPEGGAGNGAESPFPAGSFGIVASVDISTGESRVLVGIGEPDGARLGSPDIGVDLIAAPADDPSATQTVPAIFTWIVEDAFGLYRAEFDFDRPGAWQITVQPEVGNALIPAAVTVLEQTFSPNIGDPAPVVDTPTSADFPFVELTTDPEPDPRFYELSLAAALVSGKPTVLVFSTPAYCQTSACGPLLNVVKDTAGDYPDVNFIHVEVYTGLTEPDFRPDPAHLAPAAGVDYWSLPTEPWVFVIDESGIVTARFEGVMAEEELRAAL